MTHHSIFDLTAADVAARCGVSDETVRRWAKTRRIRFVTLPSGQIRFCEADVAALLVPTEPTP